MARPKNADSEETYGRILHAAHAFLRDNDMQELSLRKVAKGAGVSVGTVSYYFNSRDELVEACLDAYYDQLNEMAQRYLAELTAGQPVAEVIERAMHETFGFAVREVTLVRLQLAMIAEHGGLDDRRREGFQRRFLRRISQTLAALPSAELRLNVQILAYSVMRFASASPEERILFTGKSDDKEALEAISQHLAQTAVMLCAPRQ